MESSSTSANSSSFGSTASSTSPPTNAPDRSDSENEHVSIKQEPSIDAASATDTYDRVEWEHLLDANDVICLDDDVDDYPMDDADVAADPRRATTSAFGSSGSGTDAMDGGASRSDAFYRHPERALHDPTPASALLDTWGDYADGMLSTSAMTAPTSTFFDPSNTSTSEPASHYALDARVVPPICCVPFEKQANGQPLPLSKPIVRDDGLFVVGTEIVPRRSAKLSETMSNRLFITHASASYASHPPQVIPTHADVRSLEWLSHSTAIAAIGSDIHLLLLGRGQANDNARDHVATLTAPLRRMHADTIREVAVRLETRNRTIMIASGGFDETVVVTKLGESGDPATAKMDGKIDACDVVSSLRWNPAEAGMLSWTTDGGDFQVADVRARTKPQLQVELNSFFEIDAMGGLFGHEYLSPSTVVLGFQSGQLLFLDLRMPRKQSCYGVQKSSLGCVGEMRRSATGTCAVFGVGGFATGVVDRQGRELAGLTRARPPHSSHVRPTEYKTSGDFSYASSSFFAVSDNLGVVSVYSADSLSTKSTSASATASHGGWHERAVC